jgi:hypothetical protein
MMQHVLVVGNPAEGFRLIGPVVPNDHKLEQVTDIVFKDQYWWYLHMESLDDVWRREFEPEDELLEPACTTAGCSEDHCEECGHDMLWDPSERMYYCPNTWSHG